MNDRFWPDSAVRRSEGRRCAPAHLLGTSARIHDVDVVAKPQNGLLEAVGTTRVRVIDPPSPGGGGRGKTSIGASDCEAALPSITRRTAASRIGGGIWILT